MTVLNDAARTAITSGNIAHLVTLNADGSPQASAVWVGLDGEDIVTGTWATGRSCATSVAIPGSRCRSRPVW
jgi:hypothetical protein